MGQHQSQIEAEEELITLKLMSRIEEMEKEKQSLASKVEWEERRLKQEKAAWEAQLLESSTHLDMLKHEKETLAKRVVDEEEHIAKTLQEKLRKVLQDKVEIENKLEQEKEYISNMLQKNVTETQKEKKELHRRLEIEQQNVAMLSRECELQRLELRKFQGSSYVMQQRIIRESQRFRNLTRVKGNLTQTFESEMERKLNHIMKQQMGVSEQPLPRPTPLPEYDGVGDEDEDMVSELELCRGTSSGGPSFLKAGRQNSADSYFGETRSLPAYSPRHSPTPSCCPTPSATPFSSRSHSPINASPTRFESKRH